MRRSDQPLKLAHGTCDSGRAKVRAVGVAIAWMNYRHHRIIRLPARSLLSHDIRDPITPLDHFAIEVEQNTVTVAAIGFPLADVETAIGVEIRALA